MSYPTARDSVEMAYNCYECEPGRRRAIQKGLMTIEELSIFHHTNALANILAEDPDVEGFVGNRRKAYPIALEMTSRDFRTSMVRAHEIYQKVRKMPWG